MKGEYVPEGASLFCHLLRRPATLPDFGERFKEKSAHQFTYLLPALSMMYLFFCCNAPREEVTRLYR